MNYVFDGIIGRYELKNAYAVLLEEDHYVSPDFIYVLSKMIESHHVFCPVCKVITLGFYLKNYKTYEKDIDKLGINSWFSSKHNMGMAINADTWDEIRNCSRVIILSFYFHILLICSFSVVTMITIGIGHCSRLVSNACTKN